MPTCGLCKTDDVSIGQPAPGGATMYRCNVCGAEIYVHEPKPASKPEPAPKTAPAPKKSAAPKTVSGDKAPTPVKKKK